MIDRILFFVLIVTTLGLSDGQCADYTHIREDPVDQLVKADFVLYGRDITKGECDGNTDQCGRRTIDFEVRS